VLEGKSSSRIRVTHTCIERFFEWTSLPEFSTYRPSEQNDLDIKSLSKVQALPTLVMNNHDHVDSYSRMY
jgi:hypothetical protein